MWYYYPCGECGRPISVYDNEPNAETDVEPKLQAAIKDHYTQYHGAGKLLYTDDELFYEVRNNKKSSQEEPTW
jgi:hypothetical protein